MFKNRPSIRFRIGALINYWLYKVGLEIRRIDRKKLEPHIWTFSTPYIERDEYGPSNIHVKLGRVSKGLQFEFPEILNLNRAIVQLIGEAVRIAEIGSGTGFFAYEATANPHILVTAYESDKDTCDWAREKRGRPNIRYINGMPSCKDGPFDLVVAIEVIEHIKNYVGFIRTCAEIAPRALITTPNRARAREYYTPGPPPYEMHVREWTAGEFYWVLRCFYEEVILYAMASDAVPVYVPVSVDDKRSALIADCRKPLKKSILI